MAQMVENPSAKEETWVPPLAGEHPLEKGMATQSSILAWRTPWTEETGKQVHRVAESDTTERLTLGSISLGNNSTVF